MKNEITLVAQLQNDQFNRSQEYNPDLIGKYLLVRKFSGIFVVLYYYSLKRECEVELMVRLTEINRIVEMPTEEINNLLSVGNGVPRY